MAQIHSNYNNFVPVSTTKTLHTGSGKVHMIVAFANNASQTILIYDNTAGSGNVLLSIFLNTLCPIIIKYDSQRPLRFDTGLTVVTPANAHCHLITEA